MLKNKELKFEIIGDETKSKACLIFFHGWKGNSGSFKPFAESLKVKNAVWYLPQAPYLVEQGTNSFSWTYEISEGKYERDEPVGLIFEFIENEVLSKFDSKDVFLLGFSQGALICFEMMRIFNKPLGGIFPISGFMSKKNKEMKFLHKSQMNTPIVIGHGRDDEVISIEESELAYKLLSKESDKVLFEPYTGGHKIGYSYIKKIRGIIERKYQ